ncbi:hypothetical protein N0V90_009429 [Kalmusia sp. IMI 367209]|nr:hypothetical protein N0V90_009429 [Kalmusia sp. IMI 367209]
MSLSHFRGAIQCYQTYTPQFLYLLFRFAHFLVEVPTVRMIEYAVCRQQMSGIDSLTKTIRLMAELDEKACKSATVQEAVAHVVGWKISFDAAPGYFYEKFPIRFVWISSLFMLIGGGPFVFAAVCAALVADGTDPSSGVVVVFCLVLLKLVKDPRTPQKTTSTNADERMTEPLLSDEHQNATPTILDLPLQLHQPTSEACQTPTDSTPSPQGLIHRITHHLIALTTQLHRTPILAFTLTAFFLKSNAMASESFTFQYLSERFSWPLHKTTILRFALSLGAVLVTLLIGPLVSATLVRKGVSPPRIDLGIARISLLVLTVCFVVAWRARSSAVFILCMSAF